MLTKEQKDKWVAALRSGVYAQGSDYLKREFDIHKDGALMYEGPPRYCCLGVFCVANAIKIPTSGSFTSDAGDEDDNKPIYDMLRKVVLLDEQVSELVRRNDAGDPFTDIADYIEKELPVCDVQIPKESTRSRAS